MKRMASIDVGNDAVKAFMGEEWTPIYIPNLIAEVPDQREIIDLEKQMLDGLHVTILSGGLQRGKGTYAVGKLAARYPNNDELTPESQKSESDQSLVLLLTTLAYDAVQQQPGAPIVEVTYDLSTGLPLSEVKAGKREIFKKKLLENTHEVIFHQTPQAEGVRVRIQLGSVLVNTEGHAAMVDLTTQEDGSPRNEELLQMTVLIHDIGGLSTDAAIILPDGSVDNVNSDGIREGVSPYLDEIMDKVEKKLNSPYFKNRREVVEAIVQQDNHLFYKGNRMSIEEIVRPTLERLAREEYKLIEKMWARVPQIQRAYLIGGGSLILKPYLKELNAATNQFPLYFADQEESIWTIARSYAKLLMVALTQAEAASSEGE